MASGALRPSAEEKPARPSWWSRLASWFIVEVIPTRRSWRAHEDRWLLVLGFASWLIVGGLGSLLPTEWAIWSNLLAEAWGAGVAGTIFWRILVKREPAAQEETLLRKRGREIAEWLIEFEIACAGFGENAFRMLHDVALAGTSLGADEETELDDLYPAGWVQWLRRPHVGVSDEEQRRRLREGIVAFQTLSEVFAKEIRQHLDDAGQARFWSEIAWLREQRDEIEVTLQSGEMWLSQLPSLAGPVSRWRGRMATASRLRDGIEQTRPGGGLLWVVADCWTGDGIAVLELIEEIQGVWARMGEYGKG